MRLMVCGGAGFIGSAFVEHWRRHYPGDVIVVYDKLTHPGRRENIEHVPGIQMVVGDINDRERTAWTIRSYELECVINFAAESDNNRALRYPAAFVQANVAGTQALLDVVHKHSQIRFHQVSTCEVFGDMSLEDAIAFKETSPYRPNTPYSASKAAADLLVGAYGRTFGVPVTISRSANNYGPRQFPEKNPPLFIVKALRGERLPIFRSHYHRREWMSVWDHCTALELILLHGQVGSSYNIGTGIERSVWEMATFILASVGRSELGSIEIVPDRLGHDRRYLLDSSKIRQELDWQPRTSFEQGMLQTIKWYQENEWWWRA